MGDLTEHENALRQRILNEVTEVKSHIERANSLPSSEAKNYFRLAHESQRQTVLEDASSFLLKNEEDLLGDFADGDEIDPARIDPVLIPIMTPRDKDIFRYASLQWTVPVSSGYGRRTRFLVRDQQNNKVIAIFALGDPVIGLKARDDLIGWDKDQRFKRLYSCYDSYVLGAVDPYRKLLAGKLAALLTLSNETRNFLTNKYKGNETVISGEVKDPNPALISTTSALGRSSVYNRITYKKAKMFHSVGFTGGFGHFHISKETFNLLRDLVEEKKSDGEKEKSAFGDGSNYRIRVLQSGLEILGLPSDYLKHGIKREVFLAPTALNWDSYLRGETDVLDSYDLPVGEIGEYYRERWAIARAERMPDYRYWKRHDGALLPLLSSSHPQQMSFSTPTRIPHGQMQIDECHIRVGTRVKKIKGRTISGVRTDGLAYISEVEIDDSVIEVAEIVWDNEEKEVQALTCSNPELHGELIEQLRIPIEESEHFSRMRFMELRPAYRNTENQRLGARQTTLKKLNDRYSFNIGEEFSDLFEATVGTREEMLHDEGSRKKQICCVFPDDKRSAPVTIWVLFRLMALYADDYQKALQAPRELRRAPRIKDLEVELNE